MRVYLCWPADALQCPPPCDSFEIEDADGRAWSCTPMRLDRGGPFVSGEGIDLARMAVEGGADFVIVNAASRDQLREILAHGVRFVGFRLPVEEQAETPALCPLPSDN